MLIFFSQVLDKRRLQSLGVTNMNFLAIEEDGNLRKFSAH